MSNGGATEAENPKKRTTTDLESNEEDGFDFVLNKQVNQCQCLDH
jgi:hypothetical protein